MANIEDDGRTQAWDGVPDPLTFAQIHKKIEAFSLSYIKESSKTNFLKIRNMFKTQTVRSIQKVQSKKKISCNSNNKLRKPRPGLHPIWLHCSNHKKWKTVQSSAP